MNPVPTRAEDGTSRPWAVLRVSAAARAALVAVGGAALAVALFFHHALARGQAFLGRDPLQAYYPLHAYWAERVRRGQLPAWYPYDGLGQPFLAMVVNGPWHPSNLLYLFLSPAHAMTASILLAYLAALLGAGSWIRGLGPSRSASAAGAVVFAFSGYLVSMTENPIYLKAAAAVPWALAAGRWAGGRPSLLRSGLAGLALALILFAGDPQAFAVSCALVLAQAAVLGEGSWRRRLGPAGLAVLMAGLVGMAQIAPSLAIRGEAWASTGSEATALRWSGHPLRILDAALGPVFRTQAANEGMSPQVAAALDPASSEPWAGSQYVSALALLLAAGAAWRARRSRAGRWVMAAMALLALLWLGRYVGLYGLLHRFLPGWRSFRYPQKLSTFLILGVALGTAWGVEEVGRERAKFVVWALVGAVALVGLWGFERGGGAISQGLFAWVWPDLPDTLRRQLGANVAGAALANAGLLATAALMARVARGWTGWGLTGAIALALFVGNQAIAWTGPAELLQSPPRFVQVLAAGAPLRLGQVRVGSYVGTHPLGAQDGLAEAAFAKANLRSAAAALWGVEGRDPYLPAASRRLVAPFKALGDAPLLGVTHLVLTHAAVEHLGRQSQVIASEPRWSIDLLRVPGALPRAYLAWPRCVTDEAAALALIHSPGFVPGQEAAVECDPGTSPGSGGAGSPGQATLVSVQPEQVMVEVNARQSSVLVLNDAFYSGWSAWVDGQAAPVLPANGVVRAVPVPSGKHRVLFFFRTRGFFGVWVGLGTLLAWLLAVTLQAVLRRTRRPAR